MLDDTVIIFSSDNGGWSQGIGYAGGSNLPLRGRKGDTLEGGCRVPGFIYNAGRTGRTDEVIHISDWLPTIVAGLAGGGDTELPANLDGLNQIEMLSSPEGLSVRDEVLYEMVNFEDTEYFYTFPGLGIFNFTGAFGTALRYKEWKILLGCSTMVGCAQNTNTTESPDQVMLFNLADDPYETKNLADDPLYVDVLEELRARVMYHKDRAAPPLRAADDLAGVPVNKVFTTGWCESVYDPNDPPSCLV